MYRDEEKEVGCMEIPCSFCHGSFMEINFRIDNIPINADIVCYLLPTTLPKLATLLGKYGTSRSDICTKLVNWALLTIDIAKNFMYYQREWMGLYMNIAVCVCVGEEEDQLLMTRFLSISYIRTISMVSPNDLIPHSVGLHHIYWCKDLLHW